jgi:hypothetical protein
MDPSSFQVLFNTLHPPEDHTFVPGAIGGKIPGFVYGQAGSSNADLVEPIPYDFDPAQFISALSSQLPQVEDESPFDERIGTVSGVSGPTPGIGEQVTRKGKGKANGEGEGSKIVKVTWWRPHGAVSVCGSAEGAMLTNRRLLRQVSSIPPDTCGVTNEPGLKKITLKVRVAESPSLWRPPTPHTTFDPNNSPNK